MTYGVQMGLPEPPKRKRRVSSSKDFHCPNCKSTLFHARVMKRGLELRCWARECDWTTILRFEDKNGAEKFKELAHRSVRSINS